MKHFYGSKSIAWVDIRVVFMFYSFQGVRVDPGEELEIIDKIYPNLKIFKIYVT